MVRNIKFQFALVLIVWVLSSSLFGVVISVEDAKCVRVDTEDSYLLNSLFIKKGGTMEDRAFLEYDISGLSLAAGDVVTLEIVDMIALDHEDPVGVVDVYSYYGDGEITADDFDAGGDEAYYSFYAPGEYAEIEIGEGIIMTGYFESESIDVTSIILDAIANGQQYVGFRLSTLTADRYTLSYVPTLNIVPEPCTLVLLGLGGLLLRKSKIGFLAS